MEEAQMDELKRMRQYLMTGVSYMIPFVVIGGVFIAVAIAFSDVQAGKGAVVENPVLKNLMTVGVAAFGLMVPALAGFIAFGIADRPGIAPGMVGGALALTVKAGFLGGIVAGLIAGFLARWLKNRPIDPRLRPVMPIFVIPLVTALVTGALMIYVVGEPIAGLMSWMTSGLKSMGAGNAVLLGFVLGAMVAFDMGGPVNKVAFMFGAAMISEGVFTVMGPVAAAICIPPLGMGVATLMDRSRYSDLERDAGIGALIMGTIGITEGAIPFAAADPIRVIPSIMIGSAIGAGLAAYFACAGYAPHGGLIVLPVIDNKLSYIFSIAIGVIITAATVNTLKSKQEIKHEL